MKTEIQHLSIGTRNLRSGIVYPAVIFSGLSELYNEEIHKLSSSLNVIIMIKSRIMKWAGYVAHMAGEEERIRDFRGKATRKG
jgi:hypothetical protein